MRSLWILHLSPDAILSPLLRLPLLNPNASFLFYPCLLFCGLFLEHLDCFSSVAVKKNQKVALGLMHYGKILYPDLLRCPISAMENLPQVLHRDACLSFTRDWLWSLYRWFCLWIVPLILSPALSLGLYSFPMTWTFPFQSYRPSSLWAHWLLQDFKSIQIYSGNGLFKTFIGLSSC